MQDLNRNSPGFTRRRRRPRLLLVLPQQLLLPPPHHHTTAATAPTTATTATTPQLPPPAPLAALPLPPLAMNTLVSGSRILWGSHKGVCKGYHRCSLGGVPRPLLAGLRLYFRSVILANRRPQTRARFFDFLKNKEGDMNTESAAVAYIEEAGPVWFGFRRGLRFSSLGPV